MPAPKMLARAVALALLGITGFAAAEPQQVDPYQDTAQQDAAQGVVPLQQPAAPQQTATPPDQGQAAEVEPLGPPNIPEIPPANVPLFSWTLEAGVEQSSNINRSEDNPVSQTLLVPRYTVTYDETGTTVQAHAVGQIEYLNYLQGDFNNRLLGALAGSLNWDIAPQRLALSVLDASTVQSVDILTSNAPGNLQQVNVLSIGPVLSFRMGGTWHGQLEAHYLNTLASRSKGFDTQRELGALRLIDDLNATDQISGNFEAEHVHLENPDLVAGSIGNGYDRYDAYLHYISNIKKVTLDLTLGESRFSFDNGSVPDDNEVLARARVDWQIDLHNSVSIGGARQMADAAADMLLYPDQLLAVREMGGADLVGLGVGNAAVTADVFHERMLDGNYTWAGDRLRVSAGPYYRRLDYIGDTTLNRNERGAGLDLTWRMTPVMTAGFRAGVVRTEYTTLGRRDTSYALGPTLTDELTPHWSWRAALIHSHRNSTEPGGGYSENAAFFVLAYKP